MDYDYDTYLERKTDENNQDANIAPSELFDIELQLYSDGDFMETINVEVKVEDIEEYQINSRARCRDDEEYEYFFESATISLTDEAIRDIEALGYVNPIDLEHEYDVFKYYPSELHGEFDVSVEVKE